MHPPIGPTSASWCILTSPNQNGHHHLWPDKNKDRSKAHEGPGDVLCFLCGEEEIEKARSVAPGLRNAHGRNNAVYAVYGYAAFLAAWVWRMPSVFSDVTSRQGEVVGISLPEREHMASTTNGAPGLTTRSDRTLRTEHFGHRYERSDRTLLGAIPFPNDSIGRAFSPGHTLTFDLINLPRPEEVVQSMGWVSLHQSTHIDFLKSTTVWGKKTFRIRTSPIQ